MIANTRYTFIVCAIDNEQLYPCLCSRFDTDDLKLICTILTIEEAEKVLDGRTYFLDSKDMSALSNSFNIHFENEYAIYSFFRYDPCQLRMPYLIHTGLELPLLLQGRKQLAFMHFYSSHPDSMVLKARFDHYVAEGRLYADEECYSMIDPSGGQITAYSNQYTPMGEEWRIPARALINRSSAFTKGWTEIHERLEGMLMGYEDWQNDWWLNHLAQSGAGLYGMSFRCAVTKAGMLWLEHAGFRALPPIDGEKFTLYSSDWFDEDAARVSLEENPHIEAFVQFNIAGKHLLDIIDLRSAGPFQVPTSMIPKINSKLARDISVVLRREY